MCLGCLCSGSCGLIYSLEANKSKSEKVLATFQFSLCLKGLVLHELHIHDLAIGGEEFEEVLLSCLNALCWVQWEASEVQVVTSHLLFELESLQPEIGFSRCLLERWHDIQPMGWFLGFFFALLLVALLVLEVLERLPRILVAVEADEPEPIALS